MNRRSRYTAGLTLAELLVVLGFSNLVAFVVAPALLNSRSWSREGRCMDNLRELGIACHNYHDTWKNLPFMRGGTLTDEGEEDPFGNEMSMSGFVSLTPFFAEDWDVYDAAAARNFGPVPWQESDHWNHQFPELLCPADQHDEGKIGDSNYKFVIGTNIVGNHAFGANFNGLFGNVGVNRMDTTKRVGRVFGFGDCKDGLSYTLMLSERRNGFERDATDLAMVVASVREVRTDKVQDAYDACWTTAFRGQELTEAYPDGTKVVEAIPGSRWCDGRPFYAGITTVMPPNGPSCAFGNTDSQDGVYTASSYHEGGVIGVLGDGSVRKFSNNVDLTAWWAIGTRSSTDDVSLIFDE